MNSQRISSRLGMYLERTGEKEMSVKLSGVIVEKMDSLVIRNM